MNINDIKEIKESNDYLSDMFKRQLELKEKYEKIEFNVMKNDLFRNIHWDSIDNQLTQFRIKDYLWRISEELGESYECVENSENDEDIDQVHQLEEVTDGLHFIIELMIHLKIISYELFSIEKDFEFYQIKYKNWDQHSFYLKVFTGLGKIGNCLKNKPWKQSQMRTDVVYLRKILFKTFEYMLYIYFVNGKTPLDIYEMYMKKSEVNKFRQKTNY